VSLEELVPAGGPRRAQDLFVDRVGEGQAFDESVATVGAQVAAHADLVSLVTADRRNVLTYYGEFGIGKTKLLQRLQRRFTDGSCLTASQRRVSFLVDLHDERTLDVETLLLDVRAALGQLQNRWHAFDLALAAYWEQRHPGLAMTDFLDRNSTLARIAAQVGLAAQAQATVESLLQLPPGVWGTLTRVGLQVVGKIREAVRERRVLAECPFLEPLLALEDPEELRFRMPVLLAWDLLRYQKRHGATAVLLFDGWEDVQGNPQVPDGVEDTLAGLMYRMPNVLFVVAGRRPLQWTSPRAGFMHYSGERCWPNLRLGLSGTEPRQHAVEKLAAEDCEDFLKGVLVTDAGPAIGEEIRRRIVAEDRRPSYLDLSVNLFVEQLRRGAVDPTQFGRPFTSMVFQVLRDLTGIQRHLLRAATLSGRFDADLLRAALPHGMVAADAEIDEFVARTFVGVQPGWLPYAVDRPIRDIVQEGDEATQDRWSASEWRQARTRVLEYLGRASGAGRRNLEDIDRGKLIVAFLQGFEMAAAAEPEPVPEWLVIAAHNLQILGEWRVLGSPGGRWTDAAGRAGALAQAFLAVARRTASRAAEIEAPIRAALARPDLSSPAVQFLRLWLAKTTEEADHDERAYVEQARAEYQLVADGGGLFGDNARKDLARLDFVLGRFPLALRPAADGDGPPVARFWAATHRGQVRLANGLFEAATADLRAALDAAEATRSEHYRAIALRHLAQGLAWHRPGEAVDFARQALALNEQVGEGYYAIAECHATLAAAGSGILADAEVDEHVRESFRLLAEHDDRRNHQYLCVAEVFHACVTGDVDRARAARARQVEIGTDRGIYQYWEAVTGAWLRWRTGVEEPGSDPPVQWLDGAEETLARWTAGLAARVQLRVQACGS
jgi:tetratricopeptide (TPR) repeat protein